MRRYRGIRFSAESEELEKALSQLVSIKDVDYLRKQIKDIGKALAYIDDGLRVRQQYGDALYKRLFTVMKSLDKK